MPGRSGPILSRFRRWCLLVREMSVALNLSDNIEEFSLDASLAQTILDTISSKQGEMIVLLKRLVLAESPYTNPGSQAQVLTLLREELHQLDYDVKHIPGK